jgi:YD repeat-containing protein
MTLSEGSAIDEVRVYPADARMTTYTYDPLIGMTSSSDENNVTTFYEYDSFGRLKLIRDNNRNILKTYDYHYKE